MRIQPSTLRPAVNRFDLKRRPLAARSQRRYASTDEDKLWRALKQMERQAMFDARIPFPPLTVRPSLPR